MKRFVFAICVAFIQIGVSANAICASRQAGNEPTPTPPVASPSPTATQAPAATPITISVDDHSEYSGCYGEVSQISFSCSCEVSAPELQRLPKRLRSKRKSAAKKNKRNFDSCLRRGIYEDTQAGSSCGNPEGLRSWCERYHNGQQNCCAAECIENQARYCCQKHCGRGKFRAL